MPWRTVVFLLKFGLALNIFSFVLSCHEVSPRVPLMCFFASVTSSETSSSFPLQPRSSFMSVSSPSLSSPGRSASVSYTVDVSMFPWSASPVTPTFNEKLYPQHYHFWFLWWTFSLFDEFFSSCYLVLWNILWVYHWNQGKNTLHALFLVHEPNTNRFWKKWDDWSLIMMLISYLCIDSWCKELAVKFRQLHILNIL